MMEVAGPAQNAKRKAPATPDACGCLLPSAEGLTAISASTPCFLVVACPLDTERTVVDV